MVKKNVLLAVALCSTFTLSAQKKYEMGDPKDPNAAYLKDYRPLKEYINYDRYPNFKLGVGTTVNDYLSNRNNTKDITEGYFTETVAGNAMKMASCVDNSGNMNFSNVTQYVNTATAAGLNVYGHTLAWHSQQPIGWLTGLIADKPIDKSQCNTSISKVVATKDFTSNKSVGWTSDKSSFGYSITFDSNGMKVNTTKITDNFWDVQYVAMDNIPLDKGATGKMTITVKGSGSGIIHSKLGDWSNDCPTANISFTTEWKDVEIEYANCIGNSFLLLQNGDFVGDIYIKKIVFEQTVDAYVTTEERSTIVVKSGKKTSDAWDNQFWVVPGDFNEGDKYEFSMDVRADKAAKASTQIHTNPGTYVDWQAVGDVNFTSEWRTFKTSGTFAKAGASIAFNLNELAEENSYFFDNISFKVNGVEKIKNGDLEGTDVSSFKQKLNYGSTSGQVVAPTITKETFTNTVTSIPRTEQERHDILVDAMGLWIKGMMEACGGKVKAWDVVNEAISGGGNDGEGNYLLQHSGSYAGGTWDVGGDNFYWQDHLGDIDYVRTAVSHARKYFAEYGGKPEDLKLFINDYNLESDWDDNKKLKSLINWINKWEADGVTKIDGIGTQMHISCYMNDGTNNSKKNAIVKMFELMAASGKLVRISEMDMGMVDASGNNVPTANMTEAMHKKMADLYEFIFQKYFEIIPAEQQWGICQWCHTDSPSNSGWRANTPVGIWSLDLYRKHTYAGFVRGLGGVAYSDIKEIFEENNANEGNVYDMNGVKVGTDLETLPAGLYIKNGKKVMKH